MKFTLKAVALLMTVLVSLIKLSDHHCIIFKNISSLQSGEVSGLNGHSNCLTICNWPSKCGKFLRIQKNIPNNSFH
jgi:hypothetical protein